MSEDSKIGIGTIGFALFLYLFLIPSLIEIPTAEWKAAPTLLRNVALSPRLFPQMVAIFIGVLGVILILSDILRRRRISGQSTKGKMEVTNKTLVLATMGILGAYYCLIYIIGYLYATIPILVILTYCFGMRNWKKIILVAVICPLVIYLIAEKIMLVQLPQGMLF